MYAPTQTVFLLPTPTLKFENLLRLGGLWEKAASITFALAFFEVAQGA